MGKATKIRTLLHPEMLRELAAFLPEYIPEQTHFTYHPFVGAGTMEDPLVGNYYSYSEPVYRFCAVANHFVEVLAPFDWNKWALGREGKRLLKEKDAVASASEIQLIKLAYTLARTERFAEGTLAEYLENKTILAIVQRADVLLRTNLI